MEELDSLLLQEKWLRCSAGKTKHKAIEFVPGLGGILQKSMELFLLLLVGDLWPREFMDNLIRLF